MNISNSKESKVQYREKNDWFCIVLFHGTSTIKGYSTQIYFYTKKFYLE